MSDNPTDKIEVDFLSEWRSAPITTGDVIRIKSTGELIKVTAVQSQSASWDPINGWQITNHSPKDPA